MIHGYLWGYFGGGLAESLALVDDNALLYNNAGALAGLAPGAAAAAIPLWSGTAWLMSSGALAIGVTPTEAKGLVLRNTTPAALGAQQYSPSIFLAGQGWETGTGTSDEVVWRITNVPVQGAAASTNLDFSVSLNGAAYANVLRVDSAGLLQVTGTGVNASSGSFSTMQTGAGATAIHLSPALAIDGAATDRNYGLGPATNILKYGGDEPFVVAHMLRTDAAHAIIFASVYDRNAASITNAATMRLRSFGWTNNADAYGELQGLMADGSIIAGAIKSRVAEAAAGAIVQHVGTGTAGTASACATITAGEKKVVQVETLSPAAIETALATVVPAGSVITTVLGNCESALTGGGTTVTWSLGTTADPDKYGTAGYPTPADSLAKNSKSNWCGAVQVTADETIVLTGTATGGAADGDTALTNGSVKVLVVYYTFDAIPDAA